MKQFQMGKKTNIWQAMNSPRGEIKLTHHLIHRSQKKIYLFYRIFVLPKFNLQLKVTTKQPKMTYNWPKQHNRAFFGPKGKKARVKGPLQELTLMPLHAIDALVTVSR